MNFDLIKNFIAYKLKSKSNKGHGIHSPFVFDLLTKIINDKKVYNEYITIESIRRKLLKSKDVITVEDFGAGSKVFSSNTRKVKDIARYTLKSKKYGQLLFRLAKHFKPENILELGSSFGISTLYMAKGNYNAKVYTIEGCKEISMVAINNFTLAEAKNITLITGKFDDVLPKLLNNINRLDLAFFDGNHKKTPTLDYFKLCLQYKTNQSVFIFDDIHLSTEMEEAWNEIKANEQVSITVDLFYVGLVFFRDGVKKQDFVINF